MANPAHVTLLRRKAEVWNKWRNVQWDWTTERITPDLSGLDLDEEARFGVVLRDLDLSGVNLCGARLREADLRGANLRGADFCGAVLHRAILYRADLRGAIFSGADLREAHIREADLRGANLCGAALCEADLRETNLTEADLEKADARYCQFSRCNAVRAKLTGAKLYATARDDWSIQGVECRYVFWDVDGKIRSPKGRDLAPGEFEQLYRSLPIVEYVFRNGMTPLDPLIMDRVVQAIREQNPDYDIHIDSISVRGLAPSIKFTVQQERQKEPALVEVTRRYDAYVERLEADKSRLATLLTQALENNRLQTLLLSDVVPRIGHTVNAGNGAIAIVGNRDVTIQMIQEKAQELKEIVQEAPAKSTRRKQVKDKLLSIIDGVLTGAAKDQMKEAAKQIYELGKELGPVIVNTAAYAFFRNMMQGG